MIDSLTSNQFLKGARGITRREFVKGIAVALAGSALLAAGGRVLESVWAPAHLPLQRSTFAKHLGTAFQVNPESGGELAIQLTDVRSLGVDAGVGARANTSVYKELCFSLMFRGPGDRLLKQGTYDFAHGQIGSFALFIVPVLLRQDAQYYEAIFNCPPA